MAAQPRHLHRLLALFDPLLGCPTLVVEPHHRPAVRLQVRHNESHPRKQFAKVELDLSHHLALCLPTRGLIQKALVPNYRLVARSSHWPRQQLCNVSLQTLVGRDANRVLHAPFPQISGFANAASALKTLLTQLLLPVDFWQQQFFAARRSVLSDEIAEAQSFIQRAYQNEAAIRGDP